MLANYSIKFRYWNHIYNKDNLFVKKYNKKNSRNKTKGNYKIKGKKPIIYSNFSPRFGISNLNKQKIKNCFKWQKIKKKVRKYERNKI
jgi:hypothetical protein